MGISPSLRLLTQSEAPWIFVEGHMCCGSIYELISLRGARVELGVVCKVGGCVACVCVGAESRSLSGHDAKYGARVTHRVIVCWGRDETRSSYGKTTVAI